MSTKQIITQIAQQNGVTEHEVERDLLEAINTGFNSDDPAVQAVFKEICPDGAPPSFEDVLRFCVARVQEQLS